MKGISVKKITLSIAAATLLLGQVSPALQYRALAQSSPAQTAQRGVNSISGSENSNTNLDSAIKDGINVFLYLIGAVSVIMIIYGGFRYVTSGGDNTATTAAKNTILYAVAGLVIAFAAYAITNFVVGSLNDSDYIDDPFECNSSIDPGCSPN